MAGSRQQGLSQGLWQESGEVLNGAPSMVVLHADSCWSICLHLLQLQVMAAQRCLCAPAVMWGSWAESWGLASAKRMVGLGPGPGVDLL